MLDKLLYVNVIVGFVLMVVGKNNHGCAFAPLVLAAVSESASPDALEGVLL